MSDSPLPSTSSRFTEALSSTTSYLSTYSPSLPSLSVPSLPSSSESTRHLLDVAPHLLRPRLMSAIASLPPSSERGAITGWGGLPLALSRPVSLAHPARSLARFGAAITSGGGLSAAELRAREESAAILRDAELAAAAAAAAAASSSSKDASAKRLQHAEKEKEKEEDNSSEEEAISLLRGYEATRPGSLTGRARRREARGLAVAAPRLGLRRMGEQARGLLSAEAEAEEEQAEAAQMGAGMGKGARGKMRTKALKEAKLSEQELRAQKEEVGREKLDVGVRRTLLRKELALLDAKLSSLQLVRASLESSLLALQEEELELNDEGAGIAELLGVAMHRKGMPGAAQKGVGPGAKGAQAGGGSSRRRRGPLFLPSEHDELPSGVAFMTLAGHTGSITSLDFSEPYGALVSSSGEEASPLVWDLSSGTQVGRLRGHTAGVRALQVEEELCITGSLDASVRLWDLRRVEDWETRLEMKDEEVEPHVAEAAASKEKDEEWNPMLRKLEGHTKAVTSLYFDEGCLITGASDKTLRQWDLNTGQCVLTMDILWAASGAEAALNSSPRRSRDSFSSAGLGIGNLSAGAPLLDLNGNFSAATPAYADGSWEMYTDFVGAVQFWGYALASASGDGAVRMWDMRTGQAHRTLLGHTAPVTCLQFDETHVVSGSLDKSIRIWDLRTGAISDTIRYEYPVTALQFDTRKIVAACGENNVKIFNRTSLQHSELAINGHTAPAERLRYMDRYAVTGGKDGLIKTWAL